jgi:hypothetical protein
MKTFWIIALILHLSEDKRLDSQIDIKPFQIQTVTGII